MEMLEREGRWDEALGPEEAGAPLESSDDEPPERPRSPTPPFSRDSDAAVEAAETQYQAEMNPPGPRSMFDSD